MWRRLVFSARIKYAGRDGPTRVVRALCDWNKIYIYY